MPVYIQEPSSRQQSPMPHSTKEGMKSAPIMCPIRSRSYAPPFDPFHASGSTIKQELQPLKMTSLQSDFIAGTMQELRERAAKRQKVGDVDHAKPKHADNDEVSSSYLGDDENSIMSGQFDILEELEEHPHVIQIVATTGGLITHWNEAFTKVTSPSTSLRKIPLTIFELVDLKSLSSLYSMLALSLHNIAIDKVEDFSPGEEEECSSSDGERGQDLRPSSHLSVTLPCKLFPTLPIRYNITVVFMNDDDSEERCFLGILTPRSRFCNEEDDSLSSHESCACIRASSKFAKQSNGIFKDHRGANEDSAPLQLPCGRIVRVDDELLCQLLHCTNGIE